MEDLFKTKEAAEVFEYLKNNIHAKVVAQKENLVHLAVSDIDSLSVIGYTEVACREHSNFFAKAWFLFELGECYKLMFRGDPCIQQQLFYQYGGTVVGEYWIIEDRFCGPFSYNGEAMPTTAEVIVFIDEQRPFVT